MSISASHAHEPPASIDQSDEQPRRPLLVFDRQSIRNLDRAATEEYSIPGIVLMENAARNVAANALKMLTDQLVWSRPPRVLIVCGSGNNGGDGYAAARHLHNHGIHVTVAALGTPQPPSDAAVNRLICQRMRLAIADIERESDLQRFADIEFDLIIDAIFGTGLDRPVSGLAAAAIAWINESKSRILAVDVPSGLDSTTGGTLGCAVRADQTVTFVGWKSGFLSIEAQKLLGEIVVVDIGAPIELAERFGRRIEVAHPEAPEHHEQLDAARRRA
jgi:hydroxyethylthiazole kinase-like uncharacterized protein yjeF